MNKKCLYCYEELDSTIESDFHEQCSLSFFGTAKPPLLPYSFDQMAVLAKDVVQRSVAVPGVQPKLSLSLVKDAMKDGYAGRLTVVGALGGNYIFKPPTTHFPELPANEHLTMRMAESFGIRTVESSLIRLQSGELSYITKRMDRTNSGGKIHMLDMFQILEAVDKYKSSMEKIGKALGAYSSNTLLDKLYFFELAVFSFLTGNNDMHLKNFSMILSGNTWSFAPAYDLLNVTLANPEDKEELALTLEGKKKKITMEMFERFGRNMELNQKQVDGVFKRFLSYQPLAKKWVDRSFLSEESRLSYKAILNERYNRIGKGN